jgi:hypothetical protein
MAKIPNTVAGLFCATFLFLFSGVVFATDQPAVTTVNADLGGCRADFTVKDSSGKPVYGAKIDVSIKYGFMNLHETDLEASTNSDGQAQFTGLPNFPKKPLDFVVTSGSMSKTITDDPGKVCRTTYDVTLTPAPPPPAGSTSNPSSSSPSNLPPTNE